jgi:hypothetical protein
MAPPLPPAHRAPKAGGFLLALGIIAGVMVGGLLGQPSIGFLAGLGAGMVLVALVWLIDRRR